MSIKAYTHTDACGDLVIRMEGFLDYSSSFHLCQKLLTLNKDNPLSSMTLYMHHLDFVGSSGIGLLVETINKLVEKKSTIRLSNVKPEFYKVFKLYKLDTSKVIIENFKENEGKFMDKTY